MYGFKVIVLFFLLATSALCYAGPDDLTSNITYDRNGKKAAIAKVLEERVNTSSMEKLSKSELNKILSKLTKKYTAESLSKLLVSTSDEDIQAQIGLLVDLFGFRRVDTKNINDRKVIELLIKDKGMAELVKSGQVAEYLTQRMESYSTEVMLEKLTSELKEGKTVTAIIKNNPELFLDDNISFLMTMAYNSKEASSETVLMEQAKMLILAKEELGNNVVNLKENYTKTIQELIEKDQEGFLSNVIESDPSLEDFSIDDTRDIVRLMIDRIAKNFDLSKKNYAKIFFGSPSRNFKDGLIHQAWRYPEYPLLKNNLRFLVLVLVGNNQVFVMQHQAT